ncbi:MAG: hypothetical protein D6761_12265 [Candidatus Dadabacteria bacterium]|nr:MAG: hypothetical protein D6761_12265 [Candidatus Dadabacteria bacterium]
MPHCSPRHSRRQLLVQTAAGIAAAANPLRAQAAPSIATVPLDYLDPARPLDHVYEIMRPTLFDLGQAQIAIERSWKAYTRSGDAKYAEWASLYAFNYWRMVDLGDARIRAARIGTKLTQQFRADHPEHPGGHFWSATFLGLEAISRGILDATQLIPEYQKHLERAAAMDETYFYASPLIGLAKLYVKAPRFPVSVGNLDRGLEYLEKARPYQEKHFAIWYVFKAEADYLKTGDTAQAIRWLDAMRSVRPVDSATQYALEMSIQDGVSLRKAISGGDYNKFKWDPLLTPLQVPS